MNFLRSDAQLVAVLDANDYGQHLSQPEGMVAAAARGQTSLSCWLDIKPTRERGLSASRSSNHAFWLAQVLPVIVRVEHSHKLGIRP